jgi:hypothetical protein
MRIRFILVLVCLLAVSLAGCKSAGDTITNNYPVQLFRPEQAGQLYNWYVSKPTAALTAFSDGNGTSFSLLGYGSVPYVLVDKIYLFPLPDTWAAPTVTVEKGVAAGEQIMIDQVTKPVTKHPSPDTQYPQTGITYWAIKISSADLADWGYPTLHIVYHGMYPDTNKPYDEALYYPLSH